MTEAEKSSPKRRPLSKQERNRKIKAIYHELEAKKRELGLRAPMIKRGPVFYVAVLVVLLLIGGLVIQAAGKGGGKKMRDGNIVRAEQSVSALAEALGRFKFHCGVYPTEKEGLAALSEKFSTHAGWVGPYAERILPDPWKHPYVYERIPTCTSRRTIRRSYCRWGRTAYAARRTTSRRIRSSSRRRSRTRPGRTTGSISADVASWWCPRRRRRRNFSRKGCGIGKPLAAQRQEGSAHKQQQAAGRLWKSSSEVVISRCLPSRFVRSSCRTGWGWCASWCR